ncbi:putative cytochrome p450 protein [Rhypophila decipiens]|uniref:Cytochrome p450 protein n=1 Tax=Rhypophila decipiens TaxID=261697 RepID=A0AAN7BFT0_9PEZI|nr:putative cytochrome p450 protein [Rhypophila decipiens]
MFNNLNLTDLLNTTSNILPFSSLLPPSSSKNHNGAWSLFPGTTTTGPLLPILLLALAILYLALYALQCLKSHPNEPPILPSKIPYIGHLLSMTLQGGRYLKNLGLSHPDKPIFTLPVPNSRIYIVTDPVLALAVQRASKSLSFTPLVPDLTKRILGLDTKTVNIVRQNLDPEPGEQKGFLAEMHDMVYAALGPGMELNELSLRAVRELAEEVDSFVDASFRNSEEGKEEEVKVNLLHWVRHFVTISTAKFLYGPENPLTSSSPAEGEKLDLEAAFWDFDNGLGQLLIGIVPSLTARKPYYGREKLAAAMGDWLDSGKYLGEGVSDIVKRRVEIALRHGWDLREVSRSELSFLFAGIVNTATTSFWVVLRIFAERGLLNAVRGELEGVLTQEEGKRRGVLSLDKVKNGQACPTLMAVFKESLRVGSDNYSTRLVKSDTVLAGKYFLKKGSIIQIAGGVLHADIKIWGDDAAAFNPGRFLPGTDEKKKNGNGVHPAAFRAFGGGKTLCPGRHFATNEILAFVAILVLRFDLEPVEGDAGTGTGGMIRVPEKDDGVLPVHILEPRGDVFVRVCPRDGTYGGIEVVP